MSTPNTKRLILWIILLISSILDTVVIGMRTKSVEFVKHEADSAFYIYPTPSGSPRILGQIPLHLFPLQPTFTFTVSIASFSADIIGAILGFLLWWKDTKMYDPKPILVLKWWLTIKPVLISISVLLAFIQHSQSSRFNIEYVSVQFGGYGPRRQYELGSFDFETWVCDLAAFDSNSPLFVQGFRDRCVTELVARWLLLPWFVLSLLVARVTWWLVRDEKARSTEVLHLKNMERSQYV